MNNRNLAIGAVIVVLLVGLIMYVTNDSGNEPQPVAESAVESTPVATTETQPEPQAVAQVEPPAPAQEAAPAAPAEVEPETLGASSSGLGR
ncbi:MAG: hypothetical protein AB7F86_05400 [Bdellovibrionales bacterium]